MLKYEIKKTDKNERGKKRIGMKKKKNKNKKPPPLMFILVYWLAFRRELDHFFLM
jgi:hypothetical protein